MKFKDLKKRLIDSSPDFRREYFRRNLSLELGHLIAENRVRKGVTQEDLASRLGTQQPSVARAERGKVIPSVTFLNRVAEKLGMTLVIEFRETETHTNEVREVPNEFVSPVLSPIQMSSLNSLRPNLIDVDPSRSPENI